MLPEKMTTTLQHIFDAFLEHSPDSAVVADLHGRVLQVNKAFENLHGWKAEEVIGRFLPMTPQHLKNTAKELHQRILDGENIAGFDTFKMRKDGSVYPANLTVSPIKDYEGNIVAFAGIWRDVSEQKIAEKKLQESEERYRQLVELSEQAYRDRDQHYRRLLKLLPEPIFIHKEDVLIYVNDAGLALFGAKEQEDMVGKSIYDFIRCDYHPVVHERLKSVVLSDRQLDFKEIALVTLQGKHVEVEESSIFIYKYVDTPVIQSVFRDLTERKQTEEILRRSEKLSVVGQLAAGIAHEIRNPLTSIKGFTQLLTSGKEDRIQFYLDIMHKELDRINFIVNEFMVIAKPHMTVFKNRRIQDIIENVVTLLQSQALLYNVQFNIQIDPQLHTIVRCEENQIKQVFINVLKNAIEAMPNGGSIEIILKRKGGNKLLIRFIDQGVGIPEEKIPKLGEPFFTTKDTGTGLGLMICFRIIDAHRGTIKIKSKVNEGTTIDIELPAEEEPAIFSI